VEKYIWRTTVMVTQLHVSFILSINNLKSVYYIHYVDKTGGLFNDSYCSVLKLLP
jgi:hypothetical protein